MVGLIAMRAISERTPSTESEDKVLRQSRISLRQESTSEKKEVPCPSCEQRLKIPISHMGRVKCPACSSQFSTSSQVIEEVEETTETISQSNSPSIVSAVSSEDELPCPECQQMLRIPLDKRPVHSRCPACRTEFLAEAG